MAEKKTEPGLLEESFSAWLRDLIEGEKLSQEKAARKIDVSYKTVQRWLAKGSLPGFAELVKIRAAFGKLPPELESTKAAVAVAARSGWDVQIR